MNSIQRPLRFCMITTFYPPYRGSPGAVSLPENDDRNLRRGVLAVYDRAGRCQWFLRTNTELLSASVAVALSLHSFGQ